MAIITLTTIISSKPSPPPSFASTQPTQALHTLTWFASTHPKFYVPQTHFGQHPTFLHTTARHPHWYPSTPHSPQPKTLKHLATPHPHTHLNTNMPTVVRARRGGMYPRKAIHVACIQGLMQRGKGRLVPRRFSRKLTANCNE